MLFRPSVKAALVLAGLAAGAIGYAALLRYYAIEYSPTALACDAGSGYWMCGSRKVVLAFSQSGAFGVIAILAAGLNLVRPTIVILALAVVAAGFGLVLYNTASSATAVALMLFSLARPVPEPE